jgi:hypothetical protein
MLRLEDRRARVVWGVATLALVIFAVASLLAAGAAQRGRDDEAARRAQATVKGVLIPLLSTGDLTGPATEARAEELLAEVRTSVVDTGPAEHVTLWRPDGTILFSTRLDDVGARRADAEALLERVLEEGPDTVVEDGRFRTLVPIRQKGAEAIAEIDEPYGPIWSSANWPWRTIAFVLGFASLISLGVLAVALRPSLTRSVSSTGSPFARTRGRRAAPEAPPVAASPRPPRDVADPAGRASAERDAIERRVAEAEERAARAEAELRDLRAAMDAPGAEIEALRQELAHARAQIIKLSAANPDAERRAAEAEERARVAEERARQAEELARLSTEAGDAAGAELRAEAAEERAAEAEQQARSAERELTELRSRIQEELLQVRQEAAAAEQRARKAEERTHAAIEEAVSATEDRLRIAVRAAEQQASAAEQRAQAAEDRVAAADRELEELRALVETGGSERERLEAELAEARAGAAQADGAIAEIQAALDVAERDRAEAERLAAGSQAHVTALEAQIAELQGRLAQMGEVEGRAVAAEAMVSEVEARATAAEARALAAEQQLAVLQDGSRDVEAEHRRLTQTLEAAERRAETLEAELVETRERHDEARRDLAQVRIELEELRRKGGEQRTPDERVAELEAELELLRSRLANSEEHAARLERELESHASVPGAASNGDGKDAEQLLRIAQERLAASAEALERAEERAYAAERELKELRESAEAQVQNARASTLEAALRSMDGLGDGAVPRPEGVREDRRAASPFKAALALDAKNSLTSILGLVMTLKHKDASPEQAELLRSLNQQARKLDHLVADLMDADRLARGEVKLQRLRTDLDALVRRVVSESGLAGERNIEIFAEPVKAAVAPARIEQMLTTLLYASADRTKAGATITVRVDPAEEGALLSVEDGQPASDAAISPVVTRFAEMHGGWARVEEREGGGAAFRVLLADPVDDDAREGDGDVVVEAPELSHETT